MNCRLTSLLMCVGLSWAFVADALARRLPEPGGEVRIALGDVVTEAVKDAHTVVSVIESDESGAGQRVQTEGWDVNREWRSSVIASVVADPQRRRWTLGTAIEASLVSNALRSCFDAASSHSRWPAAVLVAAHVALEVHVAEPRVVSLSFGEPVGVLMRLLQGCVIDSEVAAGRTVGAFAVARSDSNEFEANADGLVAAPLLDRLIFVEDGEVADVTLSTLGDEGPVSTVGAAYPDVMVLLQSAAVRAKDLLGVHELQGREAFYAKLRPDLLLKVYALGRGDLTRSLLPPGIVPARLKAHHVLSAKPADTAMSLGALAEDAPVFHATYPARDLLAKGLMERVGVTLRQSGWRLQAEPIDRAENLKSGTAQLIRWRSPTPEPGLALLSFVGAHLDYFSDASQAERSPALSSLLDGSLEQRMERALELENQWTSEGRVVPLVHVDRWFDVHPALEGVHVRFDGVPIFHRAFWSRPSWR